MPSRCVTWSAMAAVGALPPDARPFRMSMPDRVELVVREALKIASPNSGVVDGGTHLSSELGLDSAQVMDMIMEIEDRLDISIPVAMIAEALTLDQLCDCIRKVVAKS